MKNNEIQGDQVYIFHGELQLDSRNGGAGLVLLIHDEYVKSKSYQKAMREKRQFTIGGSLLYKLLTELIEYINRILDRIRLEDLDLSEDNKPLLFLKKFSQSSELIEGKLKRLNSLDHSREEELFILHIAGLEDRIQFQRQEDGNSRLSLVFPTTYIFNRLISFMDKMSFQDLNRVDKEIRDSFLRQFTGLHQRVTDQKNHIEMKYAMELSRDRARDLEKENAYLMEKIHHLKFQNDLYKRSYYSLRSRNANGNGLAAEEEMEELPVLD